MKNSTFITLIALGVITGAGLIMVPKASAAETNNYPPLVQTIMEKLGLKESEVAPIVEQYRNERQSERLESRKTWISGLVSQGKLTQEQADKYLAKVQEWQNTAKPENWYSMTQQERRDYMESHREEMQQWFKDNGIDESLMRFGMMEGRGVKGHGGMGMMRGEWDND